MAEQVELETPKSGKKRSRNPAEWKREKRKRLRIAGKEYVNTRGELISGRKIGEDCRCRRKCYVNVSEDVRKKMFEGYYSLNSHDEQNAYLFGLIRKKDIARKRSKDSVRRTCTYTYYVRNRGKEIQVCRLAFAHIHGISSPKIRNLCLKLDMNVMFPRDGRGKHDHRPKKITDKTMEQIRQHIYSIIRTDRVKDFMKEEKNNGPDVNITKMWKDYLHKFEPDIDIDAISSKPQKIQHHSSFRSSEPSMINQASHVISQYGELHDTGDNFINLVDFSTGDNDQVPNILNDGSCNSELSCSQDDTTPAKSENDNHTDDDSCDDEQNRQKSKPSVKHWLYSKVFHEELKFHDFLSLRKKLWDLKEGKISSGSSLSQMENKAAASRLSKSQLLHNNFGPKSERKQKMPKKITRGKEEKEKLRVERNPGPEINVQTSCFTPSAVSHGLHTSDMYILPVQLHDISQMQPQRIQQHTALSAMDLVTSQQPHFAHHSHHQHHTSMQLNLHSFSSAVAAQHTNSNGLQCLSSVGHQQNNVQLQCLTSNTIQPVNISHNPCNYMNINTPFYQ